MASSRKTHDLTRILRAFSMAKFRYRSLLEKLSVPGSRPKTNDNLRCDKESLCLWHDACHHTAIRKEAAL